MAWIALDRAVKAVERFALEGLERWRCLGGEIRAYCAKSQDAVRDTFKQY